MMMEILTMVMDVIRFVYLKIVVMEILMDLKRVMMEIR